MPRQDYLSQQLAIADEAIQNIEARLTTSGSGIPSEKSRHCSERYDTALIVGGALLAAFLIVKSR